MVSFSLLGLQHPEPNGPRRATPTSTFQHRPGHPPDTADGLGGATHEEALEILRDSRLGTFGVSALALFLAARIGVIAAVADPLSVIAMLAAAGAISRAALAWPMALVRPARADGMSAFIGVHTVREAAVATVIAAGLALVFLGVGLTVFALAVPRWAPGPWRSWPGVRLEAKPAMSWARASKWLMCLFC